MTDISHDLARRLGRQAEAVCRHYLSAGRREGSYWMVGDVRNAPGHSMFVRLRESAKEPPGKWTDAATGEHGDLLVLDVIRESCGFIDFKDVAAEGRSFLSLPHPEPQPARRRIPIPGVSAGSPDAAGRLFAMSQPIERTLAGNVSAPSRHYHFARNRTRWLISRPRRAIRCFSTVRISMDRWT